VTRTIGIVGLGIMGGAMARNLKCAGFEVIGFDIDDAAVASSRAAGVSIAASVAAVAERTSEILLSLPNAKAAIEAAQIIATVKGRSCTVAETSTLALADKMAIHQQLFESGHTALDCPLSGTGAQAVTKDLVIFASGDPAVIQRMEPVFLGFGRQVKLLGAYGNGSKMKFVANLLVAIHNVASAEAMVLGMKAGLDPYQIVDVVASGAGNSRVFELRAPMMARNDYMPPTMRARNWKKDMVVIGEFASALECPTPLFSATTALYDAALAMGREAEDVAGVCAVFEAMAGLKRTV
jgi:L-threonate 2-dehydrogenase